MLRRMLMTALLAGAAAGLIAAVLQLFLVEPVLLHAERFESGELVHFGGPLAEPEDHDHGATSTPEEAAPAAEGHDHAGHDHGAAGEEAEGPIWIRHAFSVLFTVLLYAGYGLLLAAAFALAERRGHKVTARTGLLWGIAGFCAVQFLPAAGLAPELPGMAAADLTLRQFWWAGTVITAAIALWLIAFDPKPVTIAIAVALLLLPHLIGAPEPEAFAGPTPPELAGEFAGRALVVGMAAWALLGTFAARLWQSEAPRLA